MWTFWSLQSQFHSIWVKCLHHVVWSLWIAHLLHLQTHLPSISLLTAIESTFASKAIGFTQVSLFMIIYSVNTYAVPKVEMPVLKCFGTWDDTFWCLSYGWFHELMPLKDQVAQPYQKVCTLLIWLNQSFTEDIVVVYCRWTWAFYTMLVLQIHIHTLCSLHVHYTQQHVHGEFLLGLALGMQKYYYTMTFDLCCDIIYT